MARSAYFRSGRWPHGGCVRPECAWPGDTPRIPSLRWPRPPHSIRLTRSTLCCWRSTISTGANARTMRTRRRR